MTFYRSWYERLNIPWLVGRRNGKAEAQGLGSILDDIADDVDAATKASFPELGPADALPKLANETSIFRGVDETEDAWRARLRSCWDAWERAGWAASLLLALYYDGYRDAVIVQQNGLAYRLSLPLANDPLDSVVVEYGPALIAPLTSHVDPERTPIPEGEPWYVFDGDIEHCSRFAVLLPTQPAWWRHQALAVFDGTSTLVAATWSQPFSTAPYNVLVGAWEGADFVTPIATAGSVTTASVEIPDLAIGQVPLLGWLDGENPLCCPSDETINQVRRVIKLWRPAKALCVGIYALVRGRFEDYPTVTNAELEALAPSPTSEVVVFSAE